MVGNINEVLTVSFLRDSLNVYLSPGQTYTPENKNLWNRVLIYIYMYIYIYFWILLAKIWLRICTFMFIRDMLYSYLRL